MSASYCTVADIWNTDVSLRNAIVGYTAPAGVASFRQSANTIAQSEVEAIIAEASEMVRAILSPRYDITVIDAYSPYPPVVVYLTKVYSVIMIYERYRLQDTEFTERVIKSYQRSMKHYKQIIVNGALRDSTDTLVPTLVDPQTILGKDNTEYPAMGDLADHYEDGRYY